jgi:hypothetical protein
LTRKLSNPRLLSAHAVLEPPVAAHGNQLRPGWRGRPGEDFSDPDEIDAPSITHRREVPVLEAAAIVLEVNALNQVLDLLEILAGIEALVVGGDIAVRGIVSRPPLS